MPVPDGEWVSIALEPVANLSMPEHAARYSLRDDPEVLAPRAPSGLIFLGPGTIRAVNGLDSFGQEAFRVELVLDRAADFILLDMMETEDPVLAPRTIRSDIEAVRPNDSPLGFVRDRRVFLRRVR